MRKYSKKGLEKRKKDREGYAEFYISQVKYIKDNSVHCQECGVRLKGDVSEVAHIFPKNLFKSISILPKNILYLCSRYSDSNCHSVLDDSKKEVVHKMNVFSIIEDRFNELENLITEKIPYKIYARYQNSTEETE